MKIYHPTYQNSILQVGNSIRRFCGLTMHHDSLQEIDTWIEDQHVEQLLVVLIDGMGAHQVCQQLKKDGFFQTHMKQRIESVYPPTTVAATTALRTGCYPSESGWLGWHQYFPSVQDSITMYRNESYYHDISYPDIVETTFPLSLTVDEGKKNGCDAIELFPWSLPDCDTISGLCDEANRQLINGKRYVYAYWDGYDAYMHEHGVTVPNAVHMLQEIETTVEQLAQALPSHCGMIVLADHGHVNVREIDISIDTDLMDCLRFPPTLEARTANFYCKEGMQTTFAQRFMERYGGDFNLYTKEEVVRMGLFGEKQKMPKGEASIGDFIACAYMDAMLICGAKYAGLKGNHAGMSEDEMLVPLILYTKE